MKWVKASERLPEDYWQGKFRNINDNSLKEYKGMHELDKGRFSTGSFVIPSRLVEWLDDSPLSSNDEDDLVKSISWHLSEIKDAFGNHILAIFKCDDIARIISEDLRSKFHITKKP